MTADEDRNDAWRQFAEGMLDQEQLTTLLMLIDLSETFAERARESEVEHLEQSLAAADDVGPHPQPNECHLAYTDRREWIVRWLDDPHPPGSRETLVLPVLQKFKLTALAEIDPATFEPPRLEYLRRRRCVGLAPYVGQPYHYEWQVMVDAYGRWVAGDAVRVPHSEVTS